LEKLDRTFEAADLAVFERNGIVVSVSSYSGIGLLRRLTLLERGFEALEGALNSRCPVQRLPLGIPLMQGAGLIPNPLAHRREVEMFRFPQVGLSPQWAPLPLRLIIGYGFVAHGWAKLSRGPAEFAKLSNILVHPCQR
jgi:hypothetical protein